MSSAIIKAEKVSFKYEEGAWILKDVSLEIADKDFFALIGPNGGGKTTLLKLILGLLKPQQGSVEVLGSKPVQATSQLGYVPQFASHVQDFPITVRQLVAQGRLNRGHHNFWLSRTDRQQIEDALKATSIQDLAERPVAQLSGGQKQRVLIARALATEPKILLLDEPTAHVDGPSELQVFDLLAELRQRMTLVVVSHDLSVVSRYANKAACVNQSLHLHPLEQLNTANLQATYPYTVQTVNLKEKLA